MAQLRLWFVGGSKPSLEKTEFIPHGAGERIVAVRGLSPLSSGSTTTFIWSTALHALCILLVKHRLSLEQALESEAVLSGLAGSPAASLDYAISKQPLWLIDMFGLQENGHSRARVLFHRINPERKRPGPVIISVSKLILPIDNLEIFNAGLKITKPQDLLELAEMLEADWTGETASNKVSAANKNGLRATDPDRTLLLVSGPNQVLKLRAKLREAYLTEATHMLAKTDIFTTSGFDRLKADAVTNESFERLAGTKGKLLTGVDTELMSAHRLGIPSDQKLVDRYVRSGRPIRFALSPAHIGSLIILRYLRDVRNYRVDLNFHFSHSVEMAKRMLNDSFSSPPDICSLTVATTATVLGQNVARSYMPFMIMPRMSHAIIAPKPVNHNVQQSLAYGEYIFMSEIPATESFYFDELERGHQCERSKVSVRSTEPDEVALLLSQGDPSLRAIIGFPYYFFHETFNNCRSLSDSSSAMALKETVFFARKGFFANRDRVHAWKVVIRDAWLTLKEQPELIEQMIDSLLADESYTHFLMRCVGVHNFGPADSLIQRVLAQTIPEQRTGSV